MYESEIIKLKAENKQLKKVNLDLIADFEKHIDKRDMALLLIDNSLEKLDAINKLADKIKESI